MALAINIRNPEFSGITGTSGDLVYGGGPGAVFGTDSLPGNLSSVNLGIGTLQEYRKVFVGVTNFLTTGDITPPVISNLAISGITTTGANVTWDTDEFSTSVVNYGTNINYDLTTTGDPTLLSHVVSLNNLEEGVTYYILASSSDLSVNSNTASIASSFITADTTAPVLSGITSGNITSGNIEISWITNEPATSVVNYGPSIGLGETVIGEAGLVTSHQIGLEGLTGETQYFYEVESVDFGNNTGTSGIFNFVTLDGLPPIISNLSVATGIDSATILFDTNEAADDQIDYGTDISFGSTIGPSIAFGTAHSVAVTGLAGGITYLYKITATDVAGNSGTTGELGDLSFTIPALNININNVQPSSVTTSGFTVDWETELNSNSIIDLGDSFPPAGVYNLLSQGNATELVSSHSVTVTGLSGDTRYDFRVSSATGNTTEKSNNLFLTTVDNIAPTFLTAATQNIGFANATAVFTTDEGTTGEINWGTVGNLSNKKVTSATQTTSHSAILNNLVPLTNYEWYPVATDQAGNTSTGVTQEFTTSSIAININNISVSNVGGTSSTFDWTTAVASNSIVNYGETTAYENTQGNAGELVTNHQVILSGLNSETLYHAQVSSTSGAISELSSDITFNTLDITAPNVSSVGVTNIGLNSATMGWATNEPSTGRIDYGATQSYGSVIHSQDAFALNHSKSLQGLTFSTTYNYMITATDSAGNQGQTANKTFTTSDSALSFALSNIDVVNITPSGAVFTWETNTAGDSKVRYGPTTSYGSNVFDASNVTSHSIALTGLSESTVYNAKVISQNSPQSASSSNIIFTTLDGTPPILTEINTGNPSKTSANISWIASENINKHIEWGTDLSYSKGSSINSGLYQNIHSQQITNLDTNTKYFFYIEGADTAGNLVQAGGAGQFFTTDPVTIEISNVEANQINATGAVITWDTLGQPSSTLVDWGRTANIYTGLFGNSGETTINHSIGMAGLEDGTTFHYRVRSAASGVTGQSLDAQFSTPDVTAPIISNVQSNVISKDTVSVSWDTNEAANKKVVWGQFGNYLSGELATSGTYINGANSTTITNLSPSTQYYFQITAADQADNVSVTGSLNESFITDPNTISITNVNSSNVTSSAASITWNTSIAANSIVDYGPTIGYGSQQSLGALTTAHTIGLSNLSEQTQYHYRARSINSGQIASGQSPDFTFTTLDGTPPVITNVRVANTGSTNADIAWDTDENATSTVEYGFTTGYGETATKGTQKTQSHFLSISPLSGNQLYHYRVRSEDTDGNESVSSDNSFTTLTPSSGSSNFSDGNTVASIRGYYPGWNPFYVDFTIPLQDANDLDDSINFTIDEDTAGNICQVEVVKRDSEDNPLTAELISQVTLANPPAKGSKLNLTVKATSTPKPAASSYAPNKIGINDPSFTGFMTARMLLTQGTASSTLTDPSFNEKLIKDGHLCKQYRYYKRLLHSGIPTVGIHTYVTYFKNDPTILVEARVSNGHVNPDPNSGSTRETIGKIYFDELYIDYANGINGSKEITTAVLRNSMTEQTGLGTGSSSRLTLAKVQEQQHIMPPNSCFTRRFAIHDTGTGNKERAREESELSRLFVCQTGGLRDWHRVPGYLFGGLRIGELDSTYKTRWRGKSGILEVNTGYDGIEIPAKEWYEEGTKKRQQTGAPPGTPPPAGSGIALTGDEQGKAYGLWQPSHAKAQGPTGAPNVRPWMGCHLSIYMAKNAALLSQGSMERIFGWMYLDNGEFASVETWDAFYHNSSNSQVGETPAHTSSGIKWNWTSVINTNLYPYTYTGSNTNLVRAYNTGFCPYEGKIQQNSSNVWWDSNWAYYPIPGSNPPASYGGDQGFVSLDWQHWLPAFKHEPILSELLNDAITKDNIEAYSEMSCHGILSAFKQNGFGGGALMNKSGFPANTGTPFGRDYSPVGTLILQYAYGDTATRKRKAYTLQRLVEVINFVNPPSGVLDRRRNGTGGNTQKKTVGQWPGVDYYSSIGWNKFTDTNIGPQGKYDFATYQTQYIEGMLWGVTNLYLKNRWLNPTIEHPNDPFLTKTATQQQYNGMLQHHIDYASNFMPPDPINDPGATSAPMKKTGNGRQLIATWAVRHVASGETSIGEPGVVYNNGNSVIFATSAQTQLWDSDPAWPKQYPQIIKPVANPFQPDPYGLFGNGVSLLDNLHGWHQFVIGAVADHILNGTALNTNNKFLNGSNFYIESRSSIQAKLNWIMDLGDGIYDNLSPGNLKKINFTENGCAPLIGELQRALEAGASTGEQVKNVKLYLLRKPRVGQILIGTTPHYNDFITDNTSAQGSQKNIQWFSENGVLSPRPDFQVLGGFSKPVILRDENGVVGGNINVGTAKEFSVPIWIVHKIEESETEGGSFDFTLGIDAESV